MNRSQYERQSKTEPTVSIYEDYDGRCHFTYDRPSSLLEQFNNEEIRAVGRVLDQKMENLAETLAK